MHVFDSKITMGGGTTNDTKKRRQDKGRHKRKNRKETKKQAPEHNHTSAWYTPPKPMNQPFI